MKQHIQKHKNKIFATLGIIAAVFIILTIAVYLTWKNPAMAALQRIYPAVFVGANPISLYDMREAVELTKQVDSSVSPDFAVKKLINSVKAKMLVKKLNIDLASDAVTDEHTFYTKNKGQEYLDLLNNYFDGKSSLFNKFVVVPETYEAALKIKYNDGAKSSSAYKKAQEILGKIRQGESFEQLAKTESADKVSGQFGGDLGFFEHGEILPELEKEITIRPLGEVYDELVVSRLGYHIIYPIETATKDNKKLWHAKHILITQDGFDAWFAQQAKGIGVFYIVK